eukprot:COSAG01_NODE_45457_length_409_cov_0.938710_1_plen_62_part_10
MRRLMEAGNRRWHTAGVRLPGAEHEVREEGHTPTHTHTENMLAEIYLCDACSDHEISRLESA